MELSQVLKGPIVTEKSTKATTLGEYAFKVDKRANKKEIVKAVEGFFGVHVRAVHTMTVKGKRKKVGFSPREAKQSDWKKAIVQLAEGEKIENFGQQ